MEEVSAKLCGVRLSAQKARLVANQIRGKSVYRALEILKFSSKKAADIIKKTLKSVMYNAKKNKGMNIEKLIISGIWINEGKSLKRNLPRAKGRTDSIMKRTCHINIRVKEKNR
ncbi:50S ribosomal protein L22 [Candidatus Portiera aleyrodidarum]|uniref:Large ribosomal subunit protein uL22 n=1 Tax=Candidatus Portiera aleyrodidarum TV TaxID=1297582 RepID=A0A8D4BU64_9GAMM|nr:50S ribosomal protein L22 [Candidatus Portiera aleyrodidarum]AGI27123.1 ribosomal protein L22 [Candidatus Portiera aleyrodidarum TV]CEI59093.1 50S ribosomal protein L22 [Candidatus Portiera aleyrodidarum]